MTKITNGSDQPVYVGRHLDDIVGIKVEPGETIYTECPECLGGGQLVCPCCRGYGELFDPDDLDWHPKCCECEGRGLVECEYCCADE